MREGLPTGMSLAAWARLLCSLITSSSAPLWARPIGLLRSGVSIASWPNILLTTIVSRIGFLTFIGCGRPVFRLTHRRALVLLGLANIGYTDCLVLFFGADDVVKILYTNKYSESAYYLRF